MSAYWQRYYESLAAPVHESPFARWTLDELKKEPEGRRPSTLLDVGCGNARDTCFFAAQGLDAVGIDTTNAGFPQELADRRLFVDNMATLETQNGRHFSCIYSRFSLHAVTAAVGERFLRRAYDLLEPEGLLFIEARSTADPLMQKGILDETDSNARFYPGQHYRRFIDLPTLSLALAWLNFSVEFSGEQTGWAQSDDEDPVVIRIKARK